MKVYNGVDGAAAVPRLLPDELFHDRTRTLDAFTAGTTAAAARMRLRSAAMDRVVAADCTLWPVARPSREQCVQAAYRRNLRAADKIVLLALTACADDDGVVMASTPKFAAFCGLSVVDAVAALRQLETDRRLIAVRRTLRAGPPVVELDFAALVFRPEMWPRGDAAGAHESIAPKAHAIAGTTPALRGFAAIAATGARK